MNEPIHQHYIPKSYLKHFAEQRGKLYFVDTLMRGENELVKLLPTRDICAEKNIYTFDKKEKGDPYALEKFYASEVDEIYPKVFKTLLDTDITILHPDTKKEILNTILSLRFRRPFFLKAKIKGLEALLMRMSNSKLKGNGGEITYFYRGETHTFKEDELETELELRKKSYREAWLIGHFAEWQEFVNFKQTCGIEVITVPATCPIITSDNPINIFDLNGKLVTNNPFLPDNMIEVPLDRTHYLIIHPNAVSEKNYYNLHRSLRDEHFASGVNYKTAENADLRIIGYPGDIEKSSDAHRRLDEFTAENVSALGSMIAKTKLGMELVETIYQSGSIFTSDVAAKVKEIRKTGLLEKEPLLEKLILELAKKGFLTV